MYSRVSRHFAHLGQEKKSWKNRCHGVTVLLVENVIIYIVLLIDQYSDFLEMESSPFLRSLFCVSIVSGNQVMYQEQQSLFVPSIKTAPAPLINPAATINLILEFGLILVPRSFDSSLLGLSVLLHFSSRTHQRSYHAPSVQDGSV